MTYSGERLSGIVTFQLAENVASDEYEGEELLGGITNVWTTEDEDNHFTETTLNVKSGPYYQSTASNFICIEEKQAF